MRRVVDVPVLAALLVALVVVILGVAPVPEVWAGLYPAGSTNAVLSVVLGSDGYAEVARWWPGRTTDVAVYPWQLYWWNSCLPGDGAIMILVTAPVSLPPAWAAISDYYDPSRVARQVLEAMRAPVMRAMQLSRDTRVRDALRGMLTPGNPAYEAIKAAAPEIRSLDVYETYGYAVFLFIKWEWSFPPGCKVTVESIPEGYGIPYVK